MSPQGFVFMGPYLVPLYPRPHITIAQIKRAVVRHYGLNPIDMTCARRSRDIAWPRQVAMYLARSRTNASMPQIGRRFGDRDHTTVIHAVRAVESRRASDPKLDADIRTLEAML